MMPPKLMAPSLPPPSPTPTRDQDCAAWNKFKEADFPQNPFHLFVSGRESARLEYVYAEEARQHPALLGHLARAQFALNDLVKYCEAWAGRVPIESPALDEARTMIKVLREVGKSL